MRKGRNGEKKNGMEWRRITFIVATNIVASRLPKRCPTGTPDARANFPELQSWFLLYLKLKNILFNTTPILSGAVLKSRRVSLHGNSQDQPLTLFVGLRGGW